MKAFLLVVLVLGVGLAMLVGMNPASAAQAASLPAASTGQGDGLPSATAYLIALAVPPAESLAVPAGLLPEQAAALARTLTYQQAWPILAQLEQLQAAGKVARFEVRPDLHAVAVQLAPGADASATWARVRGAAYVAVAGDDPPACMIAAAEALAEQVRSLCQGPLPGQGRQASAGLGQQVASPSIYAHVPRGTNYTDVSGRTTPNSAVSMRILRSGGVLAIASTTSDGSGIYHFYPNYRSCPTLDYDWTLRPGDVVEVTAAGSTASTVVVPLSAWVDPVANVVTGTTVAGWAVDVMLYHYELPACPPNVYSRTVSGDSGGGFSADFAGQVDFNRRARATVCARDVNGNSTWADFHAYRIATDFDSSSFNGYLKPEVDFAARLSRGSTVLATYSGKSRPDGYYEGAFTPAIQSGDVIQVSAGGITVQYTATRLDVTLNPATDKASGTTGANRRVLAVFHKRYMWFELWGTCTDASWCVGASAETSGTFAIDAGRDLVRGDYAEFLVYDPEGNSQYLSNRPVSTIIARMALNGVEGYWPRPGATLTVLLKASDGTVKETRIGVGTNPWAGNFSTNMSGTINPNDRIEVTDGSYRETMTVQNLTARLDGGSGHLSGVAYNGPLLACVGDWQYCGSDERNYCREITVSGGSYDLTFAGAQVDAQDWAAVWSTGPDGHFTYHFAHTCVLNAQKGSNLVEGYSETPRASISVTLRRGGASLAVYAGTSMGSGYFVGNLQGVTITQGDNLQLQTGDGDHASLNIPELTLNLDRPGNRVYGRSPANQTVTTELWRQSVGSSWGMIASTTSDGAGNYSASFSGRYWSKDCSPVDARHPCSKAEASYCAADGDKVWVEGPVPPSVGADSYEVDDRSTTARPYAGIQHHTFHVITDTDWISFTVAALVPHRIETFNLGWGMATQVRLYGASLTTPLMDRTGYESKGLGVDFIWTPSAARTYYLQISPPSGWYAAYCDAIYDLLIQPIRFRLYLPTIRRNYW